MVACWHASPFAHAGFLLRLAGVKSGTNIVEDVLLLQLQQLALQLHTLTVNDAEAASVLVHLVAKMSQRHLQQLQVSKLSCWIRTSSQLTVQLYSCTAGL